MCALNQDTDPQNAETRPKNENLAIVLVYPSWTMKYALTTLANLLVLAVGITIGVYLSPHLERPVQASAEPQAATPASPPTEAEQKITAIQPSMTTGTVGFFLVLSHHIQSDELVVNGYDILKLQNEELGLLSHFVPQVEIQNAVNRGKGTGDVPD